MNYQVIARKCRSASYHLRQRINQLAAARSAAARKRHFDSWLNCLSRQPPEVWIGANFVEFGGCRHHMHALHRYSSLRTDLAPNDKALAVIPPHYFSGEFHNQFINFRPKGIRVGHSHVFPWFINWCHRYQSEGLRWIHTHHNWYYPEFGKNGLEDWQKKFNEAFIFAIKHADVSLSVSKWQQAFLRDTHGLETHYLPNGVDVGLCDAAQASRFRSVFGPKEFILYLGRNDPVKNPAEFVRLAARFPAMCFVMIGQGLSPDILNNEWDIDVPQNLIVMDEATHSEALDAIAACKLLVVTSKREGLPTLVMEAMALSKPVVVPDEQGCMEAIAGGEFGYIYKLGDIDDLATKTEIAMNDERIGRMARLRVLEEYDWNVVIKKIDSIYLGANHP